MITGINHITIAVSDVERSFDFYVNVLGFKPLCKWSKGSYFLSGNTWFCINHDVNSAATQDHNGNWQTRIVSKKSNLGSWENVEFFI